MTQRNPDGDGAGGGEGEFKGLAIIDRRPYPGCSSGNQAGTANWDSKAPVVVLSFVSIPMPHGYALAAAIATRVFRFSLIDFAWKMRKRIRIGRYVAVGPERIEHHGPVRKRHDESSKSSGINARRHCTGSGEQRRISRLVKRSVQKCGQVVDVRRQRRPHQVVVLPPQSPSGINTGLTLLSACDRGGCEDHGQRQRGALNIPRTRGLMVMTSPLRDEVQRLGQRPHEWHLE